MDVKTILINALTTAGFVAGETLFLQGTLGADTAYPDSFVTYWLSSTTTGASYDNTPLYWVWEFSIIYYADDAIQTNSKPDDIRDALTAAGFIPIGKGGDIASDEPTHTGWAMTYQFIETVTA